MLHDWIGAIFMVPPDRLELNGLAELLLIHLHTGWMNLDVVWLEALALIFLVMLILPLTLQLFHLPMNLPLQPPMEPYAERPDTNLTEEAAASGTRRSAPEHVEAAPL